MSALLGASGSDVWAHRGAPESTVSRTWVKARLMNTRHFLSQCGGFRRLSMGRFILLPRTPRTREFGSSLRDAKKRQLHETTQLFYQTSFSVQIDRPDLRAWIREAGVSVRLDHFR